MRRIIAYVSDTHAGHMHGLVNPDTKLVAMRPNGDQYEYHPDLNEIQRYLWNIYIKGIKKIKKLAGKDDIILVHGGDPTHGIKYTDAVDEQTIENQLAIATANLQPWVDNGVKYIRIVAGTGSHEFNDGSATGLIRRMMGRYKIDIKAVYHGVLNLSEYLIDYAHHGPPAGIRTWLKGNVARYYLRSLMIDEIVHGGKPPDLVLRGHVHEFVDERVRVGKHIGWLVVAPSMAMPDAYTRQVTRSIYRIRNGVTAFEIIDGRMVDIHCFHKTIDIRTKEIL